jgi:hypothetical protein
LATWVGSAKAVTSVGFGGEGKEGDDWGWEETFALRVKNQAPPPKIPPVIRREITKTAVSLD